MMFTRTSSLAAALGLVGLLLLGCGDSNVFDGLSGGSEDDATTEAGVQALNDGQWDAAIAIFEQLNAESSNPEIRKYLASAYVGRAGFDTLTLIELIAASQDAGSSESVLYGGVTQIFDDGDGVVSSADLLAREADVRAAVEVLAPAGQLGESDEEIFQAGVYAALHAVILVGGSLNAPDVSPQGLVDLGPDAVDQQVAANFVDIQSPLEADLGFVSAAADTVVNNDVGQDFENFLADIGYGDGAMTAPELAAYLNAL